MNLKSRKICIQDQLDADTSYLPVRHFCAMLPCTLELVSSTYVLYSMHTYLLVRYQIQLNDAIVEMYHVVLTYCLLFKPCD